MREAAVELLHNYLTTDHLIKHSIAVEAVMKSLAQRLDPEHEELWSVTGLLHDLDGDILDYKNDANAATKHGKLTVEILKQKQFGNDTMYHAIESHNKRSELQRDSLLDKALFAADPITGFITAIALIYPDKKLSSVKVKSITKRMNQSSFAAGANRDSMRSIEETGIPFDEFAAIALSAMQGISDDLAL